jgi:hypothetical protein
VLRLAKKYGSVPLNAACAKAKRIRSFSYKCVESILKHRLQDTAEPEKPPAAIERSHSNVRGSEYYVNRKEHDDHAVAAHH